MQAMLVCHQVMLSRGLVTDHLCLAQRSVPPKLTFHCLIYFTLAGNHHTTEEENSALCLPESNPALLTVTEDGTLRVWVEVTLTVSASRNPFDTTASPAALPGLPGGSHFCVTLLIQPPSNVWNGGPLRAAWAIPEGRVAQNTGPQIRASKVLWITAVANSKGRPNSSNPNLVIQCSYVPFTSAA